MTKQPRFTGATLRLFMITVIWLCGTLFVLQACKYFLPSEQSMETLVAIKVQQTLLAQTASAFGTPGSKTAPFLIPSPQQVELNPQLTSTQTLLVTETGTWLTQEQIPNFERRKKAARILLFENMSASGQVRFVKEALDQGGYFYLDVGSATGWFKNQLLSDQKWDLIIAAAEARREFGGEYFELINQRLETGEAAIVETWDLDQAPDGKVADLLNKCGVTFDADWYEPEMRVFFWQAPGHPLFNIPNRIPSFSNSHLFWSGDVGDLLEIRYRSGKPIGDAILLGITNPAFNDQHATLVNCFQNRLILQTFSSHDYSSQDVIRLWQNYIHYALIAKFIGEPSSMPTPILASPQPGTATIPPVNSTLLPVENLPGCEGILAGSLARPVRSQQQLFEHNAAGEFLIVTLGLENVSPAPIQIWDDDYRVEGLVQGKIRQYPIQKAATGFLYIDNPTNLWQDLVQPDQRWQTSLAFDVDSSGSDWVLVITPGSEVNEPLCEIRIPLTQ